MAKDTKQPDREDLPQGVQDRLNDLLQKDPVHMNTAQKRFVKARSAYLTKAEKHDMKAILDADAEDLQAPEVQSEPEQEAETADEADTDEDDKNEEPGENVVGYAEWGRSELFEEVDKRNEGRDEEDQISKGGSNEDIVERLIEDDVSEI